MTKLVKTVNILENQLKKVDFGFRNKYFTQNPLPSILFQYTDINGLMGVLESKMWRATHSQYLNDTEELIYGDKLMSSILEQRRMGFASDDIFKEIYNEILGVKYNKLSISSAWDEDTYITSFSENGDLLDQWRAYGDNGIGYSIGINPNNIKTKKGGSIVLTYQTSEITFIKVCYDSTEQERLFLSLIEPMEQIIRQTSNAVDRNQLPTFNKLAAKIMSRYIWDLALFYKHSAFENEKEWRVLKKHVGRRNKVMIGDLTVLKDVHFRTSNHLLIPYITLNLENNDGLLPLEKIYLGPKHRHTNAKDSLEMYLQKLKYGQNMPELIISTIPYR